MLFVHDVVVVVVEESARVWFGLTTLLVWSWAGAGVFQKEMFLQIPLISSWGRQNRNFKRRLMVSS